MKSYKRINDKEKIKYITSFVNGLLENEIPSIYLGDIPQERRNQYFCNNFLSKEKYFRIPLGTDINKYLIEKYNSATLERGCWTEANGIIFYVNKNMIVVLDYCLNTEDDVLFVNLD